MDKIDQIAEELYEYNQKKDEKEYEIDELGLGIADTPDYVAARVLLINAKEREENPGVGLVYTRRGKTELWKGNEILSKSERTIYRLAKLNRNLRGYEIDAIWESLLKNSPELDETKIVVDDYTYWDTETGELKRTDKKMLTI